MPLLSRFPLHWRMALDLGQDKRADAASTQVGQLEVRRTIADARTFCSPMLKFGRFRTKVERVVVVGMGALASIRRLALLGDLGASVILPRGQSRFGSNRSTTARPPSHARRSLASRHWINSPEPLKTRRDRERNRSGSEEMLS